MSRLWLVTMVFMTLMAKEGCQDLDQQLMGLNKTISMKEAIHIVQERYPGKVTEIELDDRQEQLVYDLKLQGSKGRYDVKMDAAKGEILDIELEVPAPQTTSGGKEVKSPQQFKIAQDEARKIALKKFNGAIKEIELENKRGVWVYDISVVRNHKEAEIEIDANSGDILYFSVENLD